MEIKYKLSFAAKRKKDEFNEFRISNKASIDNNRTNKRSVCVCVCACVCACLWMCVSINSTLPVLITLIAHIQTLEQLTDVYTDGVLISGDILIDNMSIAFKE